jgi:hypothetical protein
MEEPTGNIVIMCCTEIKLSSNNVDVQLKWKLGLRLALRLSLAKNSNRGPSVSSQRPLIISVSFTQSLFLALCPSSKPMSIHRVLIKTHHMTSRSKLASITRATKRLSCSAILKTGSPPGVMIAEGEGALEWMEIVRVSLFSVP